MILNADKRPWYKEPWPWILMAGPGLVIVAAIVTIYLAVVSNDGLVSDDYYKQGLAVNQRMQRDHEAMSLGLHADIMRSGQAIRLLVTANEGTPLPQELGLRLAHPTQSGNDQLLQMQASAQGFYEGQLKAPLAGRWHVMIEDPAGKWRLQGEWRADSEEPLRLNAKAK